MWCSSQEISDDFVKLSKLILIKGFKKSIPNDIKGTSSGYNHKKSMILFWPPNMTIWCKNVKVFLFLYCAFTS